MARAVDDPDALTSLLDRADVVALGPGLGQSEWARALFDRVLDAGAAARAGLLPAVCDDLDEISYGGEREERIRSFAGLWQALLLALLLIYGLLAIQFRSYIQPVIVMTAIPFGLVGAVIGHILLGYDLSLISLMGVIALSGVVVNDSLIMIDYANRHRGDRPARGPPRCGS